MFGPSTTRGAYDFEAWKWTHPSACGLLWGAPDSRKWHFEYAHAQHLTKNVAVNTLESMAAIARDDGVYEWWAHNGGRYDVLLIVDAIIRMGWGCNGHVAAGRVVVLFIAAPGLKKAIKLYDSQALVDSSLKSAAESFELKSSKILTNDDYSSASKSWKEYRKKWTPRLTEAGCRADCEVVLELLEKVESLTVERGGALRATFASTALTILQSSTNIPDMTDFRAVNVTAREAYLGGRVEVWHHQPRELLAEYDVCSSYPWAMTQTLPFDEPRDITSSKSLNLLLERGSGIVRADVNVPEVWLPVLPYSLNGVYFPTGKWRAWFHAHELRYAQSFGAAKVEKLISGIAFRPATPFHEFVKSVYDLKKNAKGALREFAKKLLNGCYGKFGQSPERENLRVFGDAAEAIEYLFNNPDKSRQLCEEDPRAISVVVERWAKQTHYAMAGAITAHSRILLHNYARLATRPAYGDTDSIHCSAASYLPVGNELGELKLECPAMHGEYFAPKLYRLRPVEGIELRKMKGFDKRRGETETEKAAEFAAIVAGKAQPRESMALIKTQLKTGGTAKRVKTFRKWHGYSRKRRPLSDGATIPWTVSELQAGKHEKAKSPLAPDTE